MSWLHSEKTEGDVCRARKHSEQTYGRGVLLINLGTPDSPQVKDVRRYLAEFLSDPEVIQLPAGLRWLNRGLGRLIARFRAPKSAAMYETIWTERGSPLYSITEEQATLLDDALPLGWRVFCAMRYGRPSIAETLEAVAEAGIRELVVVPMYPQYSGSTTGTALRELYGALERGGYHIDVTTRNTWFDDGGYIYAQAKLIEEYAQRHGLKPENSHLLFSAHGLPVSYVERGDPYPVHVNRTVELVAEQLGWPADKISLAYQSRLGPARWIKPSTDALLKELVEKGEKRILVCPISFTVDCLETLEEIDVRYRAEVEKEGADLYLCPALNTSELFMTALSGLVTRGPRPIASRSNNVRPLLAHPKPAEPEPCSHDSLIMVGMSLANRFGNGRGAQLKYASDDELRRAKKSQMDVPPLLREICARAGVREAMIWNTCHRFEFYGLLEDDSNAEERRSIIRHVRDVLLGGSESGSPDLNVLSGGEAWHHLARTLAGLNSGLPGDRDILDQLRTALRIAQRAGTAGPMLDRLVSDAHATERDLRGETEWGKFDPGYCFAAMSRVVESAKLDLAASRAVVVGGSTTSRSVLNTLVQDFDVSSRLLTLVYRGQSGGRIKELRKAVRGGRRIRVQSYSETQVIRAISEADIVFFGVDRDEPVLDADQLRGRRNFLAHPLTVIDFNSFGSTQGLETIPGVTLINAKELDQAVTAFADSMCSTEAFAQALDQAEQWIEGRVATREGHLAAGSGTSKAASEQRSEVGCDDEMRGEEGWLAQSQPSSDCDGAGTLAGRSTT